MESIKYLCSDIDITHGVPLCNTMLNSIINLYSGEWNMYTAKGMKAPVLSSHLIGYKCDKVCMELSLMSSWIFSLTTTSFEITTEPIVTVKFDNSISLVADKPRTRRILFGSMNNKTKEVFDGCNEIVKYAISKDLIMLVGKDYGNRIKTNEVIIGIDERQLSYLTRQARNMAMLEMLEESYMYHSYNTKQLKIQNEWKNLGFIVDTVWENLCFIVDTETDKIRFGTMNPATGDVVRLYKGKYFIINEESKETLMNYAKEYIKLLDKTVKDISNAVS